MNELARKYRAEKKDLKNEKIQNLGYQRWFTC